MAYTPITPTRLAAWAEAGVDASDPNVVAVVDATNVYVASLPAVSEAAEDDDLADVQLGALMLASRLVRRRLSPNGIEAITGDTVAYASRRDSDIARLLRLDAPRVG